MGPSRTEFVFLLPLLFLIAPTEVASQFSIPARYDGFALSGPKSTRPVVIEAFYDLLCPSCRDAWPVLKQVSKAYPESQVQIIMHPFPAPFHHNAFFAARGMHIASNFNRSLAYPWLELVFEQQDQFGWSYTLLETPKAVIERFAKLSSQLGLSPTEFLTGFEDSATDSLTRTSFKYGCHRGVVATPTYLVNGVTVLGADDTWTLDNWKELLDPLLTSVATSYASEYSATTYS